MKRLIKAFASILFLLFSLSTIAQDKPFSKEAFPNDKEGLKVALDNIKEGNKQYERGAGYYQLAIPYYLEAAKFNPENAELNYKIGVAFLNSNFKNKSLPYFQKAFELNPKLTKDLRFNLARAYHLSAEWDRAMEEYKAYRNSLDEKTEQVEIRHTLKLIGECINGKELTRNPIRVFIDNLGNTVNSKYADYSPVITADGSLIMFTSKREGTTGGGMDPVSGLFYEDIFVTTRSGKDWSTAINPGKPLNTDEHDATVGLNADGSMLLIYKSSGMGDIFSCELVGDLWSKPQKLDKNVNTDWHESSACLSADGTKLFFVSNRPDMSLGLHDIFVSEKDAKGKWGSPKNLGPTINTAYDEESVFMHPDGKTLYFSSTGHKTMGGYDIFRSVYSDGKWSEPENIGYPVNTPDDDLFFVQAANNRYGYFSSIRPDGLGEKDLYMITFLGPERPVMLNTEDNLLASVVKPVKERMIEPVVHIEKAKITLLKGVVTDALTQEPLEVEIELYDNAKNQLLATFRSNSKTGKYLVSLPSGKNYGIAVRKEDYLFHSENFDIPAIAEYQEITKDIAMKNVAVGSSIILKNIFFDFDKFTIRPESDGELERLTKLMNDVPTMRIEISGHTDNRGKSDYNQKLSENRAKAVVDYLIAKGIAADRMEYKGFGAQNPLAGNETEEGRQENRRTEFKIISR